MTATPVQPRRLTAYRPPEQTTMSFGEHLDELRRRLILALVGILPIFVIAILFGEPILEFLVQPALAALRAKGEPAMLLATSPLETFSAYFRVAFVITILAGSPWILWQLWMFVAPGLYQHERRFIYLLAPMSALLTASGAVFMYYVMLPVVLAFFISFGSGIAIERVPTAPVPPGVTLPQTAVLQADPVDPEPGTMWVNAPLRELRIAVPDQKRESTTVLAIPLTRGSGIAQQYRISEYVKMVFSFALAFSLGFQMPVVVLLLCWADVIRPDDLSTKRKYALFGTAVAAAVLTPADPLSMFVLWAPLYALYEIGVLMARLLPADRVARGLGVSIRREPADAGDA